MLPVIRVEPVGIHRVADPNPPQRYENQDEFPELEWVKMQSTQDKQHQQAL
jgi:hypothetical protein